MKKPRKKKLDPVKEVRRSARAVLGETLRGRKPGPHKVRPPDVLDPEIEHGIGDDDTHEEF